MEKRHVEERQRGGENGAAETVVMLQLRYSCYTNIFHLNIQAYILSAIIYSGVEPKSELYTVSFIEKLYMSSVPKFVVSTYTCMPPSLSRHVTEVLSEKEG